MAYSRLNNFQVNPEEQHSTANKQDSVHESGIIGTKQFEDGHTKLCVCAHVRGRLDSTIIIHLIIHQYKIINTGDETVINQPEIGEWAVENLPQIGLAAAATRLHAAGRRPGLLPSADWAAGTGWQGRGGRGGPRRVGPAGRLLGVWRRGRRRAGEIGSGAVVTREAVALFCWAFPFSSGPSLISHGIQATWKPYILKKKKKTLETITSFARREMRQLINVFSC